MRRTVLMLSVGFLISVQCHSQRWLWAVEGKTESDCWGLAIDGNANAYITGSYTDSVRFDTTLLKAFGSPQGQTFLVKFDVNGNVKWGISSEGLNSSSLSESVEAACDKSNNVIICGDFIDTITFGNDTLRSSFKTYGPNDIYLAKFNSNGNLSWAWQSTSPYNNYGGDWATSVVTDKLNNIYMAGSYTDTTTFGSYTFNTVMWNNTFLAKFDSNGNIRWVASSKAASLYCEAGNYGCTVDDSGYIYITGLFVDTVSFGTYTLMTNHPFSQFNPILETYLVKYDKTGNVVWAWQSQSGNLGYSIGYSVLTDKAQNVYLTGTISDSVFFGPYHLMGNNTMQDGGDIFLAKFSPNGNLQWVHSSQSDSGGWSGYSLYKDTLNHIYFTGGGENRSRLANLSFAGANFTIPNSCFEPSFIMKLDTSGNSLCTSMVTGGGDDMNSIVCSPSGAYVYVSGDLVDTTIFTNDTLEGVSEYPFIARWQACECGRGKIIIQSTDTVCSVAGNIQIFASPPGGILGGNAVFGNFFYPDSAKIGQYNYIHYYFTDSTGCLGTALDSVYVENCTGINRIQTNNMGIMVYPNPSNGTFNFEIRNNKSGVAHMEVYNVMGQKVFSQFSINSSQFTINLNQPAGIYFYRILSEDGNTMGNGKLIIQK